MKLTASHLLQSLLFVPHLDPNREPAPVIAPGWTLNYEVFFYLLFAVALTPLARARRAVLVSLALISLVLVGLKFSAAGALAQAYTDPILLEFVGGIWLGVAWTTRRLPGPFASGLLLGVGVATFAVVYWSVPHVDQWRALLWGAPAFAVVTGAVSAERAGVTLQVPVLNRLGDASYSIYLVHGLMVSFAARLLSLVGVSAGPLIVVCAVGCGLVGGLGCYALIERPLTQAIHRAFKPSASRAAASNAPA
jgi:exopolysaccharide production protein ExoZ